MRCAPRLLPALLLALAGSGCGGAQVEPEVASGRQTATLTIVVWSTQTQRPVPATGRLISTADGQKREVDTRAAPEAGQVITGLAPGAYRLQVQRRYDGSRTQAVEGTEELYLEPGEERALTITATDKAGDLGRRAFDQTSSTSVADSLLPLSPTRKPGPS